MTEISSIRPLDAQEELDISTTLYWVENANEIFRIKKHATPPKHLVSYCVLVDGNYILLVDHKKAGFWAPTGGHIDPNEHPLMCAAREIKEELYITPKSLIDSPILLTVTETVGDVVEKHTDVSLWYVFRGDRTHALQFDISEFNAIQWFHIDDLPSGRMDPNLTRFIQKYKITQDQLPPE